MFFSKKRSRKRAKRQRTFESMEARVVLDGGGVAALIGPAVPGYALMTEAEGTMPPYATNVETVDTDGSGDVTINDVLLPVRYLREHGVSVFDVFAGDGWEDANGDGWVTVGDVLTVVRYLRLHGIGSPAPTPSGGNLPPRGMPMSLTVTELGAISFVPAILDPEQGPLTFTVTSGPSNGTLALAPDGRTFTYFTSSFQPDAFVITGTDAEGATATSSIVVGIDLDDGPHAPIARRDVVTVAEDTPVSFSPLANDVDPDGDPFGLESHTLPLHGDLENLGGGNFRYTPFVNFTGTDAFTYAIKDEGGFTATGIVVLVVALNHAPTTINTTIQVVEDTPSAIFTVVELGMDEDGDMLAVTFQQPLNGIVEVVSGGWRYIPNVNFVGGDSASYTLSDGFNPPEEGTITFMVNPALFTGPTVSRAEVLYVLAERHPGGPVSAPPLYQDVPDTHWAFDSVQEGGQNGFFADGFAVGSLFFPSRAVTYGELADVLVQAANLPGSDFLSAAQAAGVLKPGEENRLADHVSLQRFWEMVAAAEHGNARTLSDAQLDALARALAAEFHTTY